VRGRGRVHPCAAGAVPKALVLAPWRTVLCCGRRLGGLLMSVATCTVYQVSRLAPVSGGMCGQLRDVQRADVEVIVFKQTTRVAQIGCRQILGKRAIVLCFVSGGALRNGLREEGWLLRRREGVDRSEGGAGFSRSSAHGL
jgi:hypothetical protein